VTGKGIARVIILFLPGINFSPQKTLCTFIIIIIIIIIITTTTTIIIIISKKVKKYLYTPRMRLGGEEV
jgi:hypothetical protein